MPYFNSLKDYVEEKYAEVQLWSTKRLLYKFFLVIPRLLMDILMDAFIEIALLLLLGYVFYHLAQGRDLIVSLFEPHGLYGSFRLVVTALTIILYALCMWLIPAFWFEKQVRKYGSKGSNFEKHLFFVHRLLPLLPFWMFSIFIFHETSIQIFLVGTMVLEIAVMYCVNHVTWFKNRKNIIVIYWSAVTALLGIYVMARYQKDYFSVKLAWSYFLIFLSFLFYWFVKHCDNKIIQTLEKGDNTVSSYKKFKLNTRIYFALLIFLMIVMFLCLFKLNLKELAPESILLFILAFYVFVIDLVHYLASFSDKSRFFVNGSLVVIVFFIWLAKANIRSKLYDLSYDPNGGMAYGMQDLPTFDDYYEHWKQRIINRPFDTQPYPIFLIAGEGGGSRAGFWFTQTMMTLDLQAEGRFKDHIFSMSTVSGSSIGLGAMLSYWQFLKESRLEPTEKWMQYPAKVFHYNYVGGATLDLLTKDLWKSVLPGIAWLDNRNKELQLEESVCIQRSLYEVANDIALPEFKIWGRYDSVPGMPGQMYMKREYMNYYLDRDSKGMFSFKDDLPLSLINACRSEDGRRSIFSAIRMDSSQVMDAIDLSRYIYSDHFKSDTTAVRGLRRSVSLGVACNTSELFPIFNGPAYVTDLGYFVDAGYHDNSGLKTTVEIYHELMCRLKHDFDSSCYRVYILYIKNGKNQKKYYPGKVQMESADMQPLNALTTMPFSGSASYFEEEVKRQVGPSAFIRYQLDYAKLLDSTDHVSADMNMTPKVQKEMMNDLIDGNQNELNFPLARWLSNFTIARMTERCDVEYANHQPVLRHLVEHMRLAPPFGGK